MNSPRPTALIRQYLQLERLDYLLSERTREVKQLMRHEGLAIIDRKSLTQGLWIQYRLHNRIYEVIFTLPMLNAEIAGIIPGTKAGDLA